MTNQVIANPEDIERFTSELRQFNQLISDSSNRLQSGFHRLGDTWKDQEHHKFATEFERTMRVFHRFIESSERQIPFLQRKAQHLRVYLNQSQKR